MTVYKKDIRNNRIWGTNSVFSGLYKIENYVDEYTTKVLNLQNNQIESLKEDLADWINKTMGIRYLSGDNILNELDNGAVLCHLAQLIEARANIAIKAGLTKRPQPRMSKKFFENAVRRSFFSRDNMENFIKFCRSLGIHQNLLFESDDLVLQNRPRNVIICLLEVARIATHYGVEPPNLIHLEKDIANEERRAYIESDIGSQLCWQFRSLPAHFDEHETIRPTNSSSPVESTNNQLVPYKINVLKNNETSYFSLPQMVSEVASIDADQLSRSSKDESFKYFDTKIVESDTGFDELDNKVEYAAQLLHLNCRCVSRRFVKLRIKKIGQGKYKIAGRNIFARLLKNQHVMVRVGGGWDTIEHFLRRHDPCQVNGKDCKTFLSARNVPSNNSKRYSYYNTLKKILRPGESAV